MTNGVLYFSFSRFSFGDVSAQRWHTRAVRAIYAVSVSKRFRCHEEGGDVGDVTSVATLSIDQVVLETRLHTHGCDMLCSLVLNGTGSARLISPVL